MNMVLRLGCLAVADATALTTLAPDFGRLAAHLRAPHAWIEQAGADGATAELAAAALWSAALWLAAGLLAVAAAQVPGAVGRGGRRVARLVLPAALRRVAAGVVGIGITVAPAAAGAAAPTTVAPPGTVACLASQLPVAAHLSATPSAGGHVPTPVWPTTPTRPTTPHVRTPSAAAHPVVVRRGDSLWSIAAEHLPHPASDARIAARWPRWYAGNRAVIGADPDRIEPGQVLHPPAAHPAGPSLRAEENRA